MENKKILNLFNSWFLGHHKELGLQVFQVTWVKDWLPGFYDFEIFIRIRNKTYIGRGIDSDEDLAFAKSGAEAIERSICDEHRISSCGVAVHTDRLLAQLNAKNELIEKDQFFCHYLVRKPFKIIESESDIPNIDFHRIQHKLKKHGIEIQIFEMLTVNNTRSIICLSKGKKIGLILGLGTSEDLREAKQKAISECLINTVATLRGKVQPISLDDFMRLASPPTVYHRRVHLKNKALIQNHDWMWKGDNSPTKNETFNVDRFQYIEMRSKDILLKNVPLIAIQCVNPDLQRSFYGPFDKRYINMNRLRKFLGKPVDSLSVNRCLHPLG